MIKIIWEGLIEYYWNGWVDYNILFLFEYNSKEFIISFSSKDWKKISESFKFTYIYEPDDTDLSRIDKIKEKKELKNINENDLLDFLNKNIDKIKEEINKTQNKEKTIKDYNGQVLKNLI